MKAEKMCTISILRNLEGSILLTANRDELRTRGELGLKQDKRSNVQRIFPVDAQANGTWLGVNNYGVVAAILNFYEVPYQGTLSRGLIIPSLLEFECLSDARSWINESLKLADYSAFTLLLMDREEVYRYRWDGVTLQEQVLDFTKQHFHGAHKSNSTKNNFSSGFLESSSSVDLHNTLSHRHKLFQLWQEQGGDEKSILGFHLARDENNSSPSVCMARKLSHTKSISQIRLDATGGQFCYMAPDCIDAMVNTIPSLEASKLEAMKTVKFDLLEAQSTCVSEALVGR